jgi:uncharacterized membrane protein (UPF0182 family)
VKKSKKTLYKTIIAFLIILLVLAGIAAVRIYYEYLQFAEIGYQYIDIFFKNIRAQLAAQGASFLFVLLFLLADHFVLWKIVYKENKDLTIFRRPFFIFILTFIGALLLSSIISSKIYEGALTFSNATWFGERDPVLGKDLGYYIFTRPFYMALVKGIKGLLLFNIIYTALVYILLQLRGGISEFKQIFKNKPVFVHNFVNVMLYVVATALTFKFTGESQLFGRFCNVVGAGFTQIKIWMVYYNIAPLLLILIVPLGLYFLVKGKFKRALIAVLVFPAVWVLAFSIATLNQVLIVEPDELAVQQPYLQYNIDMTRKAYGLDAVEEETYDVQQNLSYRTITKNNDMLSNINISDEAPLLSGINKLQSMGTYYTFYDSDLVPYTIDGQKTYLSIAARELDNAKLDTTTDTYVNKNFRYTHGSGIVMTDTARIGTDGQPIFRIKDLPPLSDVGYPWVKEPRIYYGEKTDNSVVVKTNYTEIDYENNEQNNPYSYQGFGGIQMTPLNRTLLSLMTADYQLLFNRQITSESRALINRNILNRVKKVAPFFMYDSDPYMIVTEQGELKWIIDAYAVTNQYPYATNVGRINYIRGCAKVVVDPYNGTLDFYITDKDNPFIKTYQKMYPTLFKNEEIPETIAQHLRYPQTLFEIQSDVYRKYHTTDVASFYAGADSWEFAKEKNAKGEVQNVASYYTLVNRAEETQSVLMRPYTLQNNNSMIGWISVGTDQENYGKLKAYRLNQTDDNQIYGTMQIENRIRSDETISAELSQLSENGAQVSMGRVYALPIDQSFLYIKPVYVMGSGNSAAYPELKRMIVSYNDKVVMDATLRDALEVLFGKKQAHSKELFPKQDTQTLDELIDRVIESYDSMKEYNKASDWENSGKAMKELEETMVKLKEKKQQIDKETNFVGPPEAEADER